MLIKDLIGRDLIHALMHQVTQPSIVFLTLALIDTERNNNDNLFKQMNRRLIVEIDVFKCYKRGTAMKEGQGHHHQHSHKHNHSHNHEHTHDNQKHEHMHEHAHEHDHEHSHEHTPQAERHEHTGDHGLHDHNHIKHEEDSHYHKH